MNLRGVFDLGTDVEWVMLVFPMGGCDVQGKGWIVDNLKDIHDYLENEKLAMDVADEISKWLAKLKKDYPKEKIEIKDQDAKNLRDSADRWLKRIRRELINIPILRIELQSGLNPDELRKVADKLPSEFISEKTWKKLTDIEKSDFSDAARCLLLGTATPSVMVALRGGEASIRNYYRSKTKSDPGEKTWRQLTKELKDNATDLDIEDTFIGYLDYIGDAKRNFAQHPNKIYSLREAVIAFMQVVGLIEDIYAQI